MTDLAHSDGFLGRQPILDRAQRLFAYELLFREGGRDNYAAFADGNLASARVIANAFSELSMANALGPYQGFIKIDQGLLTSDLIEALPAHVVVLEILETVIPSPTILARCAALRAAGFALAVRVRPESPAQSRPLLELAEVIKVDLSRVAPERLSALAAELRPYGRTLLAEKVESVEQMETCRTLGFELFQGYYFARPLIIQGRRLQPSELALLRLLALLSRDADNSAVEKALKQEPALTLNLLRLTNSAGSGMTTRITSLGHAITLLGRRQLMRWLQLLLYSATPGDEHGVSPLLQLAATRGRLMELLVDRTPEAPAGGRELIDQAYLAGILSLMPVLLGCPLAVVLNELPVAPAVQGALETRVGVLGDLLTLVEALERDDTDALAAACARRPEIDAPFANACLSRALSWANNLAREAQ